MTVRQPRQRRGGKSLVQAGHQAPGTAPVFGCRRTGIAALPQGGIGDDEQSVTDFADDLPFRVFDLAIGRLWYRDFLTLRAGDDDRAPVATETQTIPHPINRYARPTFF